MIKETAKTEVTRKVKTMVMTEKEVLLSEECILINAEELSIEEVLKHDAKTMAEFRTKVEITRAIERGVKNFYIPKYEPYYRADLNCVCFEAGKTSNVIRHAAWWDDFARDYAPDHNSRLASRDEYWAFLGVLIKELVAEGQSEEWAWNAVCNDYDELLEYWNSKETEGGAEIKSKIICGNKNKILESENFPFKGIIYPRVGEDFSSEFKSLVEFTHITDDLIDTDGVGMIVFS